MSVCNIWDVFLLAFDWARNFGVDGRQMVGQSSDSQLAGDTPDVFVFLLFLQFYGWHW